MFVFIPFKLYKHNREGATGVFLAEKYLPCTPAAPDATMFTQTMDATSAMTSPVQQKRRQRQQEAWPPRSLLPWRSPDELLLWRLVRRRRFEACRHGSCSKESIGPTGQEWCACPGRPLHETCGLTWALRPRSFVKSTALHGRRAVGDLKQHFKVINVLFRVDAYLGGRP